MFGCGEGVLSPPRGTRAPTKSDARVTSADERISALAGADNAVARRIKRNNDIQRQCWMERDGKMPRKAFVLRKSKRISAKIILDSKLVLGGKNVGILKQF